MINSIFTRFRVSKLNCLRPLLDTHDELQHTGVKSYECADTFLEHSNANADTAFNT